MRKNPKSGVLFDRDYEGSQKEYYFVRLPGIIGFCLRRVFNIENGLFMASGAKIFTFTYFFYLQPNLLFSIISVVITGVIPSQGKQGRYGGINMSLTSMWGSEKRG